MADGGPVLLVVRSRHGADEDVGGGDLGRGDKRAARYHALDQPVEIDFLDMHLAVVDGVDDMLADVNARDLVARARDQRGGGQADIPEAEDGDRSEEHTSELQSLMRTSYADFYLKKTHQVKKQTAR